MHGTSGLNAFWDAVNQHYRRPPTATDSSCSEESTIPLKKVQERALTALPKSRGKSGNAQIKENIAWIPAVAVPALFVSDVSAHAVEPSVTDCVFPNMCLRTLPLGRFRTPWPRSPLQLFLGGRYVLLFAYGTTSSGKAFTMQGPHEDRGLFPQVLDHLFRILGSNLSETVTFRRDHFDGVTNLSCKEEIVIEEQLTALLAKHRSREVIELRTCGVLPLRRPSSAVAAMEQKRSQCGCQRTRSTMRSITRACTTCSAHIGLASGQLVRT